MPDVTIPDLPPSTSSAWLFPGQGAQHVGMGKDLYDEIPAARAVFEAADEALGFPLSELCFEGPEEVLMRTVFTQPALLTHSIAALVAAIDTGTVTERPAFVAGHSLGEYTALVAASAVSFEEGIQLVSERGRLMDECCERHPGTMAAVLGLERDQVAELCAAHGASLCNENAAGNISIGGTAAAVEATTQAAEAAGATRIVPLAVAGAFHTPLMQDAADGLRPVLASAAFTDPTVPVVSNVTGQPLSGGAAFAAELVDQVTSPVLWVDGVRTMLAAGVTSFAEFGPGRVLTGTVRRTERSAETRNIATAADARGEAPEE